MCSDCGISDPGGTHQARDTLSATNKGAHLLLQSGMRGIGHRDTWDRLCDMARWWMRYSGRLARALKQRLRVHRQLYYPLPASRMSPIRRPSGDPGQTLDRH